MVAALSPEGMIILDITGILVLALAFLAMFGALAYFASYWMDLRQKCPELDVYLAARKKPRPLIVNLVDLSGRILTFKGTKARPQDPHLKKDDYGLLLDPRLASKMPKSTLEDGTPILFYGANFHFPISPNGARTMVQLIRKIRKEYPQLNFIRDDIVIMELLTKSGEDLPRDITNVLAMYPQEEGQGRGISEVL